MIKSDHDGDPTTQPKDTLCDIGGPMTRSKTKRMKQALQYLIMEIKSSQGGLEATPHWVIFLQVDEDLSPT